MNVRTGPSLSFRTSGFAAKPLRTRRPLLNHFGRGKFVHGQKLTHIPWLTAIDIELSVSSRGDRFGYYFEQPMIEIVELSAFCEAYSDLSMSEGPSNVAGFNSRPHAHRQLPTAFDRRFQFRASPPDRRDNRLQNPNDRCLRCRGFGHAKRRRASVSSPRHLYSRCARASQA
jgi:hypothetical protein